MKGSSLELVVRALLAATTNDQQRREMCRWLERQDPGPDPASDSFERGERRRKLDAIAEAQVVVVSGGLLP